MEAVIQEFGLSSVLPLLADVALKSALLLALAAVAVLALRKSSAASRHLVWSAALAGVLLLPLFSLVLPAWQTSWIPQWRTENTEQGAGSRETTAAISTPSATSVLSVEPAQRIGSETTALQDPPTLPSLEPAVATTTLPAATATQLETQNPKLATPLPQPQTVNRELESYLLLAWLTGAAVALTPLLFGGWQIARLTRCCAPMGDFRWNKLLADTAAELRLRRPVALRTGPGVLMPLTWGAWRPALLLPETAADWLESRRRLVLLHELAHIQRWDWLTQTLAYFACAVYWFNPLAWIAARRMRIEREQACDDLVLRHGARPSDYADELLRFAETGKSSAGLDWAAVPMARRSSLELRVRALLDAGRHRATLTRGMAVCALLLAAMLVIPISMLRAAAPETRKEPSVQNTPTQNSPEAKAPANPTTPSAPANGALETRTLRLAYPEKAPELLKALAGVNASYDDHTNTLVFTAPAEQMPQIEEQIRKLVPIHQVEVESLIMEVDAKILEEVRSRRTSVEAQKSLNDVLSQGQPLSVLDGYKVRMVIDALDQSQGTDLFAAPKVTILSGKEAEIVVMDAMPKPTEVPSPTAVAAEKAGISVQELGYGPGVKIKVIPVVEGEFIAYSVLISLIREVTEPQAGGAPARRFETSELFARGRMKDGETMVYNLGQTPEGRKRFVFMTFSLISPEGTLAKPSPNAAARPNAGPTGSLYEIPTIITPGPVEPHPAQPQPIPQLPGFLQSASTPANPAGNAAFSPVVERAISIVGDNNAYDLETGEYVKISPEDLLSEQKARAAGVDLYQTRAHNIDRLIALDLLVLPAEGWDFDGITAGEARSLIAKAQTPSAAPAPSMSFLDPGTYVFSNGRNLGVLQIYAPAGNIRLPVNIVRFRYKMVQFAEAASATPGQIERRTVNIREISPSLPFGSPGAVLVSGEIGAQGGMISMPLPPGGKLTLTEAVTRAGGFTELSNKQVTLVRR